MLSEKAKQARSQKKREWDERNREHVREYHKDWRKRNPDKVRANNERYFERLAERLGNGSKGFENGSETVRNANAMQAHNRHGTVTDRNAIVTENRCPVCGASITGRKKYCSNACKMKAYRNKQK